MVEIEWDERLFAASKAWIESECVSASALSAAVGIDDSTLKILIEAGLLPAATYQIGGAGVVSPVARMGTVDTVSHSYYGPAVVTWLRRCAAHLAAHGRAAFERSLRDWLSTDFAAKIAAEAALAQHHAWSELFDREGCPVREKVSAAADELWASWFDGGWAVCLRRFDAHHVVVKDIEVARVAGIAARPREDWNVIELAEAMLRYDAVARPFAPFERTMSSRCKTIDAIGATGAVPWPTGRDDPQ